MKKGKLCNLRCGDSIVIDKCIWKRDCVSELMFEFNVNGKKEDKV